MFPTSIPAQFELDIRGLAQRIRTGRGHDEIEPVVFGQSDGARVRPDDLAAVQGCLIGKLRQSLLQRGEKGLAQTRHDEACEGGRRQDLKGQQARSTGPGESGNPPSGEGLPCPDRRPPAFRRALRSG